MARKKIDKETILCRAAQIVNSSDDRSISLKLLADDLGIQSPSLYYYFKNLDDLKRGLMLYGWRQMEKNLLYSMVGVSGYEALKSMAHTFFDYAIENPGLFSLMLWYNQFEDEETAEAISEVFAALIKIMDTLNISKTNACHLIRMFRGFLQGFSQLVIHRAFDNSISIKESFELSLDVIIEGMKLLEAR